MNGKPSSPFFSALSFVFKERLDQHKQQSLNLMHLSWMFTWFTIKDTKIRSSNLNWLIIHVDTYTYIHTSRCICKYMHMHSHMHMHTYTCIHTHMHALSPLKIHHLHFWLSIYHQRCHFACHLVGYSGVIVALLLLPFQRALPHYLSLIWHVYPCPLSHLVRCLRHWHRYCLIHILVWNTPPKK